MKIAWKPLFRAKYYGFISRCSYKFSPSVFLLLYYTLVRLGIEYAAVVWSPFYQCHIQRIEAVQKKFLHIMAYKSDINIYNVTNYHIDYDYISDMFNIQSLQSRRYYTEALLV